MPFLAEQLSQQRALMPAFGGAFGAAQYIDVIPKLAGFIFAQLAQLPVVAPCLLPPALDDALLGQGVQRVTAESRAADTAIQAVENVVPAAVGDELRDGARPHAAPISVPALIPAVDGDLTLGGLVVRIGFGGTVPATEVLEENRYRIKPCRAGDYQFRYCRALNLQRLGRFVFCGHGSPPIHCDELKTMLKCLLIFER